MDDTIGVDISKPTLDAFRLRTREHRQFPNDRAGCAALIRWIGASAVHATSISASCDSARAVPASTDLKRSRGDSSDMDFVNLASG